MGDVITAGPNLLAFRYRAPRTVATSNPEAPPEIQAAQVGVAHGLGLAEQEIRRAGLDPEIAPHVARMAVLMFLTAFDGAPDRAGAVFDALIDRCRREGWTR